MTQNRPHHRHRHNDRNRNRDRDREKERPSVATESVETVAVQPRMPISTPAAVMQNTDNLEQLRVNMQLAVLEMEKLRAEHITLSERIRTLGNEVPNSRISLPPFNEEGTILVKDKIMVFVGALDAYVASESEISPSSDMSGT